MHVDFGAKATTYVDAFMHNISWAVADTTFTQIGA